MRGHSWWIVTGCAVVVAAAGFAVLRTAPEAWFAYAPLSGERYRPANAQQRLGIVVMIVGTATGVLAVGYRVTRAYFLRSTKNE
ncbi:hypothetical protein [Ruania halotolerans]|uniref:hypothetical protein n=1 Tax=Ruania halotolerans TaxID=2897773 RepID=UPI001E47A540|nr:hypothetical protein [Ruania halotolerans]UFU06405.1 hypothetical protein LQF10_18595 [Ruania halotolerans]